MSNNGLAGAEVSRRLLVMKAQEEEFPTPESLEGELPPPLPIGALGEIAGPMIAAVALSYQVPVDLVITMALPMITAAARGQWRVRVGPDWTEALPLCTVAVANSGERKSPVNRTLSAPLHEYEQELRDGGAGSLARHRAKHEMQTDRVTKLKTKAAQTDAQGDIEEYLHAAEDLATDVILPPARWVADDVTPEGLVKLLSEQGGAIGAISDEAGIFGILAGRYGGKPNVEAVLQATSGYRITVDRKGSEPISIPNPALSMGLAIQPGLLADLSSASLRHSGFLARFLWSVGEPRIGTRPIEENPVPTEIAELWKKHLVGLAAVAHEKWIARSVPPDTRIVGVSSRPKVTTLELTCAAKDRLDEFRLELEPRLHPRTGDLASIADWGSKLPGQVVRIAAALTLLSNPEADYINSDRLSDAIQLGRAYIMHAVAAFSRIHGRSASIQPAVEVLGWLTTRKQQKFTARIVYQALRGRTWVNDAETIRTALARLETLGHIRRIEEPQGPSKSGRPTEQFELHSSYLS